MSKKLGFKKIEDWYTCTAGDFSACGGATLLDSHKGSPAGVLRAAYTDTDWHPWLFKSTPRGYFNNDKNQKAYLLWVMQELEMKDLDDWYLVGRGELDQMKGGYVFKQQGGIIKLLKTHFPEKKWNIRKFSAANEKTQRYAYKIIKSFLEGEEVLSNWRGEALYFKQSGYKMELDMYIPKYKLAIEYQGEQHYMRHYLNGSPANQIARDAEKKEACAEAGITLVEIPYWWDFKRSSLLATMNYYRPDAFPDPGQGRRIPTDPPTMQEPTLYNVSAISLMRYGRYRNTIDTTGWWVTRIRDGVRVFWDGFALYNTFGIKVNAPMEWLQEFPEHVPLEGQLRSDDMAGMLETYDRASYDPHKQQYVSDWNDIIFYAFDMPMSRDNFSQRLDNMKYWINEEAPHVKVVPYAKCSHSEEFGLMIQDAREDMNNTLGLYLVDGSSKYTPGLSDSALIYETIKQREGIIVSVHKQVEKHDEEQDEDHVMNCITDTGEKFSIALPYTLRNLSGKQIFSYRYSVDGHFGIPQNPQFVRLRPDLKFKQLLERNQTQWHLDYKPNRTSYCKQCAKELPKYQPRIRAFGSYKTTDNSINAASYSFCCSSECIDIAILQETSAEDNGYTTRSILPPWNRKIAASEDIPYLKLKDLSLNQYFKFVNL